MTLADLRKVTVKRQLRIRFALSNGMECILNEHGIAHIPALHSVPAFNLEDELAGVREFVLEPVALNEKQKNQPKPRTCSRDELTALAAGGADAATHENED